MRRRCVTWVNTWRCVTRPHAPRQSLLRRSSTQAAIAALDIPRTLLVPALYDHGLNTHTEFTFYAGIPARQYDCSTQHVALSKWSERHSRGPEAG